MRIFRVFFLVLHLAALTGLLLMLLNTVVPPKIFPWFNFLSLAFPFLIVLHLAFSVFWLLLKKKRAVFFLLCTLVFIQPVRRWVNYSAEKKAAAGIKAITFNCHNMSSAEGDAAEDFLKKEQADIIFLQEAGLKNRKLQGILPHEITRYTTIAFLSRYPIVKEGQILGNDDNNGNALYADVNVDGRILRCINAYLEPFYLAKKMVKPAGDYQQNEEKARKLVGQMIPSFKTHQEQVAKILQFIRDSPYPVVLGGDLNSVPNSYEYYQLSNVLQDGFLQAGNGSATTFHDYVFPIRIDYLFGSREIRFNSYRVDRSVTSSDHFPVIGYFKF